MRYAGKLGKECESAILRYCFILLCYTYIDLIRHLNIQYRCKLLGVV